MSDSLVVLYEKERIPSGPSAPSPRVLPRSGRTLAAARAAHLPFDSAREAAVSRGLDGAKAYRLWLRAEGRIDLPLDPQREYEGSWRGWEHFLGTEIIGFEVARTRTRQLGLRTFNAYKSWWRSNPILRRGLPFSPVTHYAEDWVSWPDFLGTSRKGSVAEDLIHDHLVRNGVAFRHEYTDPTCQDRARLRFDFAVFHEGKLACVIEYHGEQHYHPIIKWGGAKALACNQRRDGLKVKWCEERGIPLLVIPYTAFAQMGDLLTDFLRRHRGLPIAEALAMPAQMLCHPIVWRPFEEARSFVRSLGFTNKRQLQRWSASGERPGDIPALPENVYAEYAGWKDWIGRDSLITHWDKMAMWLGYDDALAVVSALSFPSAHAYRRWAKDNQVGHRVPCKPEVVYRGRWRGWPEYLGSDRRSTREVSAGFLSFEEAREAARAMGLGSGAAWRAYTRSADRRMDLPVNPEVHYRGQFEGITDWLGLDDRFVGLDELRVMVAAAGVRTGEEYYAWAQGMPRSARVPRSPQSTYKGRGWDGWASFLPPRAYRWVTYEECRRFAASHGVRSQKAWVELCASGLRPWNVPSNPNLAYRGEWRSYRHFFGTEAA